MVKKQAKCLGQISLMAELDTTPLDPNIITPNDPRFDSFISRWDKSKFFGLDIETQNVDSFGDGLNHFRGKIRLIQVSLPKSDEVLIVDMQESVPLVFLETLKKTCESKTQHQVGAFIQFDLTWLEYHLGIESNCPYDIRILSILLWCGIKWDSNGKRMNHSLKAIYERLFGGKVDKEEQLSDWSQPKLSNSQLNYAAKDARIVLPCFLELSKRLKEFDNLPDLMGRPCRMKLTEIAKVECFAIPVFVKIILTGQPINLNLAAKVRKQYTDAIEDIYKPVEEVLNLSYSASAPRLASAIYEKLDILLVEETPSYNDAGEEEDRDEKVTLSQLSLLGKPMPSLDKNQKLSTASSNLFHYYIATENDYLLRISLCRSLKKAVDSLDALVKSAESWDGYAKGRYTSLGSTGSGRSTCAGDKRSSLDQTNLQNITGTVDHPIVNAYNLPPIRCIITNQDRPTNLKETEVEDRNMWLVDLSASHLRIAANSSCDEMLNKILELSDPHSFLTSKMLAMDGKDFSQEYCAAHKKDSEIAYYRAIAKVALY